MSIIQHRIMQADNDATSSGLSAMNGEAGNPPLGGP